MITTKTIWAFASIAVFFAACGSEEEKTPAASTCELSVFASGLDKPFGMLMDGEDILVSADGVILRVKSDGTFTQLATVTKSSFAGLTRRGQYVIGMDNRALTVIQFDPQTWTSTAIASNVGAGVSIEVDGDDLILSDYNDVMNNLTNRLVRVRPDGTSEAIASEGLGGPSGIIVESDGYLVTDFVGGRVLKITRSGEVSVELEGLGQPVEFKLHSGIFYLTDYAGGSSAGRILKVNRATKQMTSLDVSGLGSPSGLIIHNGDIYTTDLTGGRLLRLTGCLE